MKSRIFYIFVIFTAFNVERYACQTTACESTNLINYMLDSLEPAGTISASSNALSAISASNQDTSAAWSASATDTSPYIEFNFTREVFVSVVKLAGLSGSFVETYTISFQVKMGGSVLFYPILDSESDASSAVRVFSNTGGSATDFGENVLCPRIRTMVLRIHPKTWVGTVPTIRADIRGCNTHLSCSYCAASCMCPWGYADPECSRWNMPPVDCEDEAFRDGFEKYDSVVFITPPGHPSFPVYCMFNFIGGGWTVLLSRADDGVSFDKPMSEYEQGFGEMDRERSYWLGLQKINQMTQMSYNNYKALVYAESIDGDFGIALYHKFSVGDATANYELSISNYKIGTSTMGDSFSSMDKLKFYANDADTPSNCAQINSGGWWYATAGSCIGSSANKLTGQYGNHDSGKGIVWMTYKGLTESLLVPRLMIRRSPLEVLIPQHMPKRPFPADCQDILNENPTAQSLNYYIYTGGSQYGMYVYCDMAAHGGGWLVIQKRDSLRNSPTLSFDRPFNDYVNGFGDTWGEHWLGLQKLRDITYPTVDYMGYDMMIVLEGANGEASSTLLKDIYVGEANDVFSVTTSEVDDTMAESAGDAMQAQFGNGFGTFDQPWGEAVCPTASISGGWWWSTSTCEDAHLNGEFGHPDPNNNVLWSTNSFQILATKIMIRPMYKIKPIDCEDVQRMLGATATSGVYTIFPFNHRAVKTYCNFDLDIPGFGTGWTAIQRHADPQSSFNRTWYEYRHGFSSNYPISDTTDLWIGNEYLYYMSMFELSVVFRIMHHSNNTWYHAIYPSVTWASEFESYKMTVRLYSAGSSTVDGSLLQSSYQYEFSTLDRPAYPCVSDLLVAGWWLNPECSSEINLNGVLGYTGPELNYGATWSTLHGNDFLGAAATEIYIKRQSIPASVPTSNINKFTTIKSFIGSPLSLYQIDCTQGGKDDSYYGGRLQLQHPWITGLLVWKRINCVAYPNTTKDCAYWQKNSASDVERWHSRAFASLQTTEAFNFSSYCDNEAWGGGWTLVSRRIDGTTNFNRPVANYENAFGDPDGDFWIGLRALRELTSADLYTALIEMRYNEQYGYIQLSNFWVRNNASSVLDLQWSRTMPGSTVINMLPVLSRFRSDPACGGGPWWLPSNCTAGVDVNLNGLFGVQADYRNSIFWKSFYVNSSYPLSWVEIKIRSASNNFTTWIRANGYYCDQGTLTIGATTTADDCKEFAMNQPKVQRSAMFYSSNSTCHVRDIACKKAEGFTDAAVDSYFRNDIEMTPHRICGPAPIMKNAAATIISMPSEFRLSYTCKDGYRNALDITKSSTNLTCNEVTLRWTGVWLDCQPFCGQLKLYANNAYVTPYTYFNSTTAVFTTACLEGYDYEYGDITRTCSPPYTAFSGENLKCTTRCRNELLSKIGNWNGLITASSGRAELVDGNTAHFWSPAPSDTEPYVQVNFGKEMAVSVIQIAGSGSSWTTSFSVRFALRHRGMAWQLYPVLTDMTNPFSSPLIIQGSTSGEQASWTPYTFCPVLRTQMVRIHPETWVGTVPTLRLLVKGCPNHNGCHQCCKTGADCSCRCAVGYNGDKTCSALSMPPVDCEDIAARNPSSTSGVYMIYPPGVAGAPLEVYCDMERLGGGWTVLQARVDKSQDFSLDWNAYKTGFGNMSANFWLGLDNMRKLTNSKYYSYGVLFYMESRSSDAAFAYYDSLKIADELSNYKLKLGNFDGNAGDGFKDFSDKPFSTHDADHDSMVTENCAQTANGGGWFSNCGSSNINGMYEGTGFQGIVWTTFRGMESLKSMRMMIRRSPMNYVVPGLRPSNAWYPTDCEDIKDENPSAASGVYTISPANSDPVNVYCDMSLIGGGWTAFQRRIDGTQDFYQNWTSYKNGFGDPAKSFWLGNEALHKLTSLNQYTLAIYLESNDGIKTTVTYNHFRIENEHQKYRLHVEGFNGLSYIGDSLSGHNGFQFSTKDQDNDNWASSCAQQHMGAWWYGACQDSNLNGAYGSTSSQGLNWYTWKGYGESMKVTAMLLRRYSKAPKTEKPFDCHDILLGRPDAVNGVYSIYLPTAVPHVFEPVQVYCEMAALGGGWTVIQANVDNKILFNRTLSEYKIGFGDPAGSHWLGLDFIKQLTSESDVYYDLVVSLEDADGDRRSATYLPFVLSNQPMFGGGGISPTSSGPNDTYYVMSEDFNPYNDIEDAGNGFEKYSAPQFRTIDAYPNDCILQGGAPWFYGNDPSSCANANLNGIKGSTEYERGIYWSSWHADRSVSLASARLMIRPTFRKMYDCADGANFEMYSNVRWIYPPGMKPLKVSCHQHSHKANIHGYGWTTIMRNQMWPMNIADWQEYKNGVGDPYGDYHIGLENIHKLTNMADYALVITFTRTQNTAARKKRESSDVQHAYYEHFAVRSESDGYRLVLTGFDSTEMMTYYDDPMEGHIGQRFSTFDNGSSSQCASTNDNFAWWYMPDDCYTILTQIPDGESTPYVIHELSIMRKTRAAISSCGDVLQRTPGAYSGIYEIDTQSYGDRYVFCDLDLRIPGMPWGGPGWMAFARKRSNSLNFSRSSMEYQYGFDEFSGPPWPYYNNNNYRRKRDGFRGNNDPNVTTDYYVGHQFLQAVTEFGAQMLMIQLTSEDGTTHRSFYDDFTLGYPSSYTISWSNYLAEFSTAGDGMESLNGSTFRTYDYPSNAAVDNCDAAAHQSGWWYPVNASGSCEQLDTFLFGWVNDMSDHKMSFETFTAPIYGAEMYIKPMEPKVFKLADSEHIHESMSIVRQNCPRYTKVEGQPMRIAITGMQGFFSKSACVPFEPKPMDCSYYHSIDNTTKSGEATIYLNHTKSTYKAYCDHDTMGGGWTVIQRRINNSTSFERNMTEYEQGFGSPTGNFWIGLEAIRGLTETQQYELLVEIRILDSYAVAWYGDFAVQTSEYLLFINDYSTASSAGDSLSYVNGSRFIVDSCGTGGWWFPRDCPEHSYPFGGKKKRAAEWEPIQSNLNAAYDRNNSADNYMYWATFDPSDYSQSAVDFVWTEMKIRTKQKRSKFIHMPNLEIVSGEPPTIGGVTSAEQCQNVCLNQDYLCHIAMWNSDNLDCIPSDGHVVFTSYLVNGDSESYIAVAEPGQGFDYCGPPPNMNGTYMNVTIGDSINVTYSCKPGLVNISPFVDGQETLLQCIDDETGKWRGLWLDCAELCGSIPDTSDSNATLLSFIIENGVANYTFGCLEGTYYQSGDYFVTCQHPYTNFTGELLQCTSTPCPSPPSVANSTNSSFALGDYWSRVVNQTIDYQCVDGYVVMNSSNTVQSTTCSENGLWSPEPVDCVPDCQPVGGCFNGGSCLLPNTCACVAGWVGTNCSEPDCSSIGTCLNGGTCIAPSVCGCSEGWFSANCSKANCSSIGECQNGGLCVAPNNCSCAAGWQGANCVMPDCSGIGECQNEGNCTAPNSCTCPLGWMGVDCATPDCGGCLNGGTCIEPFNCSCNQFWNGSRCELPIGAGAINITLTDDISLPDPANLSDAALVLKNVELTAAVSSTAEAINNVNNGSVVVDAAISFMSTVKTLLARYAKLAESMPPEALENLTKTYAASSDVVMASALESETTTKSAVVDDGSSKCKILSSVDIEMSDPELAATIPNPSAQQSNKLLNDFGSMVESLIVLFKMILKTGADFTYNGRFFSGVIKNVPLEKLSGLSLHSQLASVDFPVVNDPFDMLKDIPSGLTATTPVTVVLMAYVANVIDSSKPFNLPTVSLSLYHENNIELQQNPAKSCLITGRPAGKKAQLLGEQKKDAQCDISSIKCDPGENGDSLSSLVTFPVDAKAGDFVFIFPPDEMDYTAYIALNSTPTPTNVHWQVQVDSSGASIVSSNKTLGELALNYKNRKSEFRAVLRKSSFAKFIGSKSFDSPLKMYVNLKRNLSGYGALDDLPSSICEMQRCFGYHIRVANAGSKSEGTRRKRNTGEDDAEEFELEPNSTESSVTFKSSYFGDFGADLAIMPNTIEFSDVFANFSQLLADNIAVFAFQIAIILFFLLAIGFSVNFDKKDLREWAFLPLRSNHFEDEHRYLLSVSHYGARRFDLIPKVYIKVYGDIQSTGWRCLDDGTRKNFHGKLPANFLLSTFVPIGKLDACEVAIGTFKRENPGEKTFEMTIDKITIVDVQTAEKYVFLAKKKLKAGQSCLFELAKEDDIKGFRYLVSSHSRTGLPESHPWLSITRRPLPSNWTRTERLACVVSALFMAMLVNAMFYGKEASAPRVGISIAGVFRISWFTIWTSMFGAVIVIPPTAIMAFIFKRVKRRSAEKSQWATIFNLKIEPGHLEDDPNQKKKKKSFQLPWGCVVIGWILVAGAVGVSSFMVIMYSLSWGREKSLQWLSGMIMHIVQDIIAIQTIKVMLFSVFNSTLLSLPDDGLGVGKQVYAPCPEKPKTELFKRLRNVIAGIFHHFIYVAAFAAVIGTTLNFYSYRQVRDVKSLVELSSIEPRLGTVNDSSVIFDWLDRKLLPGFLLGNQLINGFNFQKRSFYRVPNHDVALMGPIRLRQQRVTKAPCYLEGAIVKALVEKPAKWLVTNETAPCQRNYISMTGLGDNSEKRLFNMSWTTFADESSVNVSDNSFHPWIYRETSGPPYTGWQGDYKSGGYFVDLPIQITKAKAVVASLRSARWIDNSTGVFFVDFVLYNPQVNIFVAVKVVFESLSAGGMTYHMRLSPLNLYQYSGASSFLAFALQGLWLITLISHFVKILIQMKKQGFKKFRSDGWNILNCLQILMSFGIVALFAARIYVIINTVSRFQTDRTTFMDLDLLAGWEELMFGMYGLAFFLTMLLFFRHLQANKHWAMFLGTLSRGKSEIGSFIIVFVIITMMFSIFGYLSLGDTCIEFRSFSASVMTLVQNIIGVSGSLMSLSFTSRFIMVFCLAYSTIVMFLAVNVFMTIISVTYGTVANNVEEHTNWDVDLADYISDEWRKILNKEAPEPVQEIGRRRKPTLTNVIKRLDSFVDRHVSKEQDKYFKHENFVKAWHDQLRKCSRHVARPPTTNMFGVDYSWKPRDGNQSARTLPAHPDGGIAATSRRQIFNQPVADFDVNVIYPFGH